MNYIIATIKFKIAKLKVREKMLPRKLARRNLIPELGKPEIQQIISAILGIGHNAFGIETTYYSFVNCAVQFNVVLCRRRSCCISDSFLLFIGLLKMAMESYNSNMRSSI